MKIKKKYMPICLNVAGEKCLVIGGGEVVSRKIKTLLRFNADITCLSPSIGTQIKNVIKNKQIKYLKAMYSNSISIKKYKILIVTASDEKLNRGILQRCRKEKVLVNIMTGRYRG